LTVEKEYYRRLDKSEKNRCTEIYKRFVTDEDLEFNQLAPELFRSEVAPKLGEKQLALVGGFDQESILTATPFYPKIIVQICPYCKCNKNPALLEPYLEKDRIIPILSSEYQKYDDNFADLILRYPHLSLYEYKTYRDISLFSKVAKGGIVEARCPHCVNTYEKDVKRFIEKLDLNSDTKTLLNVSFDNFLGALSPFLDPEAGLFSSFESALKENNITKINQVLATGEQVYKLRSAQSFSAIPQLSGTEINTANKLISAYPELKTKYEISYARGSVLNQLKLSYNPEMPVETYLDIVSRKQGKIQKIVNDCIGSGDSPDIDSIGAVQKEVEKINQEIREIVTSKRAKLLNITTGFVASNPAIIAGALFGAFIGLPVSMIGCGIGAGGGGLSGSIISKIGKVNVPKEVKESTQSFTELVEPAYERFLAYSLSKDIKAIQVWRLQKEFEKKQATKIH
jgi:hypothetical protein